MQQKLECRQIEKQGELDIIVMGTITGAPL